MDELKPCPWCGHSAEMEPQGYTNEALVLCPQCSRGIIGECGDIDDAIAAWNALPRHPQWTTYTGEESALPRDGQSVMVHRKFIGKAPGRYVNREWRIIRSTGEMLYTKTQKGDRWMPWPGEE